MVQKSCIVCGNVFNATANHKACSEECRIEQRAIRCKRTARSRMNKVCVICGKPFVVTSNGRQMTCSKGCSYTLDKKRKEKRIETRRCVVCGITLANVRGSTKTCDGACRNNRRRQLKNTYNKQYTRNREKAREAYLKWISLPENRQRVRESQKRYDERRRYTSEAIAKRRAYDAKRREWKKQKDLKAYQAERRRIDALCRKRKLSEMTEEELIAHRKKKADEMREWVKRNPEKRAANRRRSRIRQNMKASNASFGLAVQVLKSFDKENNHD